MLDQSILLLMAQVTGITAYIKNLIPSEIRAKMKWYMLALLPVVVGFGFSFTSPNISIIQGIMAGFLSAIGYKTQTTVVNKLGNKNS